MNRARDNNRGVAYEQYLIDRAAEVAEEQRLQQEAEAQNPVVQYQNAMNAEMESVRDTIRNYRISEASLPGERGQWPNAERCIDNFKAWAFSTSTFQKYMGHTLLDMLERNSLLPTAANFSACHALLLKYAAYPDQPAQLAAQEAQPEVEEPILASAAIQKRFEDRKTKVLGIVDGVPYTEEALEHLPSKEELRIRRRLEGRIGSSTYDTFLETRDAQQVRDLKTARIAAEGIGGAR